MSKIRPDLPTYDAAMDRFVTEVIQGFLSLDPLFALVLRRRSIHRGPIRNIRGSKPLDQVMQPIETTTSLKMETVRNTDVADHTSFLTEFAETNRAKLGIGFIKGMEELTNATGNVFSAGGQPFSWDHYMDAIEKMPLGFDASGKPLLPAIVATPQMNEQIRNIQASPEQEQRFAKLMEKKKAEFNAKKRTRRLSREHQE